MRIKILSVFCLALISFIACESSSQTPNSLKTNLTDRERDGLVGEVKAVLTDDVIVSEQNGQQVETQQASSTSIYDESGKRTTQTPYRLSLQGGYALIQHDLMFNPQARAQKVEESIANFSGKWIKTYDNGGKLTEGIRYDGAGKQLETLSVRYEYDDQRNWIKRVTRRSNPDNQNEPQQSEISNRYIIYFTTAQKSDSLIAKPIPSSESQPKSQFPPNEDNLSRGRMLFNQKCAACHGEDGKSQTPFASAMPIKPLDLTSEKVRALSEGELYSIVSNGGLSGPIHAYKGRVSDESLWRLALYTNKLSRDPSAAVSDEQKMTASSSSKPVQPTPQPQGERRYQFKGKVISVERDSRQVTVEHEEIKGYMGAMTMPFPLNDEKTLNRIKKDDRIEATLVVGEGKWELKNVVIK